MSIYILTLLLLPIISSSENCQSPMIDGNIWMLDGDTYTQEVHSNSTITFNLCEPIDPPCTPADNTTVCIELDDNNECVDFVYRASTDSSFAFKEETATDEETCIRLAAVDDHELPDDIDPVMIEYDGTPDESITIRYNYGDYCMMIDGVASNYGLEVNIACDQNDTSSAMIYQSSTQINDCLIALNYESQYGCQDPDATLDPTLEPTNMPTLTPIGDIADDDFSLYGKFSKYYPDTDILIGFHVEVSKECEFIRYTFIQPDVDTWISMGFGGEYDLGSSEDAVSTTESPHDTTETPLGTASFDNTGEESDSHEDGYSEEEKMNGYALMSVTADNIFETELQAGMIPIPWENSYLYDCLVTVNDGTRYTTCRRPYDCGDDPEEGCEDLLFYQYKYGANDIIWGWGPVINGATMEHGTNGIGEAHSDTLWLDGDANCGYASEVKSGDDGKSDSETAWMITGIVFIILFAVLLGILIYLLYRIKSDPDQRNKFNHVSDNPDENVAINSN